MRVISGSARGIKIDTLEGLDTRPTTDKVKGAIFSMIQTKVFNAKGLDLFSGSGALGIELLSRGADSVIMIEKNPLLKPIIEANLSRAHLNEKAKLISSDVYSALNTLKGLKFDLIFMDPPYLKGDVKNCLDAIETLDLLAENGLVVVEHDISDTEILRGSEYYESLKTKKYGKIGITVFRRHA